MIRIHIAENPHELGKAAGKAAAVLIRQAIKENGGANIILATGTSQFETLNQLITEEEIDWRKVTMFHLDEYVGLPITAPASFRKYLQERFLSKVGPLKAVWLIDGETDALAECARVGSAIDNNPIDVALVGIGENSHLAFNDPPADFETQQPFIVVELDEACRRQQWGEGWFKTFENVPHRAISMSIRQIMKSTHIICSVPDQRKAWAVKNSLEQPISNQYPASILRGHKSCTFYLDTFSASLLSPT